jgi:hypothetical protein
MQLWKKYKKCWFRIVAYISGPVFIISFIVWNYLQPPQAYFLIDTIQKGTNKKEVQNILGCPNRTSPDGFTFYYYRYCACGTLYVIFDEQQKLKEYYYEPY